MVSKAAASKVRVVIRPSQVAGLAMPATRDLPALGGSEPVSPVNPALAATRVRLATVAVIIVEEEVPVSMGLPDPPDRPVPAGVPIEGQTQIGIEPVLVHRGRNRNSIRMGKYLRISYNFPLYHREGRSGAGSRRD